MYAPKLPELQFQNVEKELGIDNVDECADWQVNLESGELAQLIGQDAVDRLWQVPSLLEGDDVGNDGNVQEHVPAKRKSTWGKVL